MNLKEKIETLESIFKEFETEVSEHWEVIQYDQDAISEIAKAYQDSNPEIVGLYSYLITRAMKEW